MVRMMAPRVDVGAPRFTAPPRYGSVALMLGMPKTRWFTRKKLACGALEEFAR